MRHFSINAIITAMGDEERLYKKLASYAPDDKLNRDDVRTLLFILEQYRGELESLACDRKRAMRHTASNQL